MKLNINIDTTNTAEIQEAILYLEAMIGKIPEEDELTPVETLTQAASHQAREQIMPETHITAQEIPESTDSAEDILNQVKKEEPDKDPLPPPAVIEEEF
jgi:hypothetical protein